MEVQEHIERHIALHKSLDELLADFIIHNPNKYFNNTTVQELIEWSYTQTKNPTDTIIYGH